MIVYTLCIDIEADSGVAVEDVEMDEEAGEPSGVELVFPDRIAPDLELFLPDDVIDSLVTRYLLSSAARRASGSRLDHWRHALDALEEAKREDQRSKLDPGPLYDPDAL